MRMLFVNKLKNNIKTLGRGDQKKRIV